MEPSAHAGLDEPEQRQNDRFAFVGDALALDVVNTERLIKGTRRDLLPSPDALARWWQHAQEHYSTLELEAGNQAVRSGDSRSLEAFKALRAALRELFEDVMTGRTVREEPLALLNATLQMGVHVLEQTPSGTFRLRAQAGTQPEAPVLLPVVRSAVWLLTEGTRDRLHVCHNPRCQMLFYDRTRSATRQWCSLKCMDRVRSARRYQQAKEERSEPEGRTKKKRGNG